MSYSLPSPSGSSRVSEVDEDLVLRPPPAYAPYVTDEKVPPISVSDTSGGQTSSDSINRPNSWGGSVQSGRSLVLLQDSIDGPSSPGALYLYYRSYTQDGAVESKHSFDSGDTSLGRINANWVAPPHTTASVKRHLCREEGLGDYTSASLYDNISSPSPLDDKAIISILSGVGPGSSPGEPLALVVNAEAVDPGTSSNPNSQSVIALPQKFFNPKPEKVEKPAVPRLTTWLSLKRPRTNKDKGPQRSASTVSPPSPSTKRQRHERFKNNAKAKFDVTLSDRDWLSYKKGEILFTDGLKRLCGPNKMEVILAQNTAGAIGYVYIDDVDIF